MVNTNMPSEKNRKGFARGFTLIELMVAIAVLGILLAIAMPSYTKYIRESRRAQAQSEMLQMRIGMEKWRANNSTYSSTVSDSGFTGANDYYTYTITGASGSAYTINAAAVATKSQANDATSGGTSCTPMTLNQSGVKTPAACWKK